MKRIFMVILTVILLLNIVSCGNNNEIGTENEIIAENQLGLKPATYDFFKTIVDVSMAPVEMDVEEDKNMLHAITCFNGEVSLAYYSFEEAKDALNYFDEFIDESSFGTQVMQKEDGDYEIIKYENADRAHIISRLGNTVLYGSSREGIEMVEIWFECFGYNVAA